MEEETLGRGHKGGGKEELEKEEWVSLSEFHSIPWVSGRPRYDKTTQLH